MNWICLIKGHDERHLGPYQIEWKSRLEAGKPIYYTVCARCERTLRKWTK